MTSQIDGGYDANKDSNFQQLAPYLGSTTAPSVSTSAYGTTPFEVSSVFTEQNAQIQPTITGDKSYFTEVLAIYVKEILKAHNANGFTPVVSPIDDTAVQTVLGDFFASYNPDSSAHHLSPARTPPTTMSGLANDLIDWIQDQPAYRYQAIGGALTPSNLGNLKTNLTTVLQLVVDANLGLWTSSSAAVNAANLKSLTTFNFVPTVSVPLDPLGFGPGTFVVQDATDPINLTPPILDAFGAPTASNWSYRSYGTSLNTDTNFLNGTSLDNAIGLDNFASSDARFGASGAGADLLDDIRARSTAEFLSSLNLKSVPSGALSGFDAVVTGAESYYARFAYAVTYAQVFAAFNTSIPVSGVITAAGAALRNFIYDQMYLDPASTAAFVSSQDFGPWFTKVQEDYIRSLNGVAALNQTALSESAAKTQIIQRIYALIVAMIGIIQKTTAAQADQLKVLTTLQGEMTNMISKAPILTSSQDNQLSNNTEANASTVRDELNQVVTAWTDTIRANRDFQKSLAQSVQTNVNSSNDAVNQQASMATALIQQQSTILSAIYR